MAKSCIILIDFLIQILFNRIQTNATLFQKKILLFVLKNAIKRHKVLSFLLSQDILWDDFLVNFIQMQL